MSRALVLFLFCAAAAIASPAQTFTKLVTFNVTNGAIPFAPLIQATDGNLYGTTSDGGANMDGTVFKITPEGMLTPLHSFDGTDGSYVVAGLTQATDGNFYGAATFGGTNGYGTLFRITPEGTLTPLHSFDGTDGSEPAASLVQATDGNFYGTTRTGGANNYGTVFKITPEGSLTPLYSFDFTDGAHPEASLVQATDGNLYGTTVDGGAYEDGTVFKITPQGVLTTLHSFGDADGASPYTPLVQATDGNLYGTTVFGGVNNNCVGGCGTVFKITLEGALTPLYSFCAQPGCTDGTDPGGELVQATDGNFYGTTQFGGANNYGTIFKITPEGELTTLHSFDFTDGTVPQAGLVQATDGSFYGTAAEGGANSDYCGLGCGTVFLLDTGFFAALSLTKNGSGTVASGDGHIYCGGVCEYPYPKGAQTGLTAIPAPGYTFDGFTGCDNMQNGVCLVQMSSAKNVTATFSVSNVALTSLTLNPSSVKGGNISIATITLNAPAPDGGLGVAVTTDHPEAVHPPSLVSVPAGRTTFGFAVRTTPVRSTIVANVTASANASQASATLTVAPTYESLR